MGSDSNGASCGCTCPWGGQPWGGAALGVGHGGRASRPNIGLEPTRNSLRSSLAAALARGSGPALGAH